MERETHNAMRLEGEQGDARRYERYRVDLRLKVITGMSVTGRSIYGRGSDISEGGMRVFVPADLNIGETVLLELSLPYLGQKVLVHGVLRNRHGFSYGVEFSVSTTSYDRELIARACKALSLVQ